jgi:hypothetical protein
METFYPYKELALPCVALQKVFQLYTLKALGHERINCKGMVALPGDVPLPGLLHHKFEPIVAS